MFTSNIAKTKTTYTYDTLGNLVYEKVKNKFVDYQYNELNQLVNGLTARTRPTRTSMIRGGNRIAETGKKESRAFTYDETNHLVEETNWKGDKSAYTYNALFVRINNTQTSQSGNVYDRDYVTDYTSIERDDLMIYAEGNGQLDYVQREVYAGSERIEQFTDRSNSGYERTLYVHEDVQGNTWYYTKTNGNSFAELTYDAWGMPVSPNKLLNNDHGNYVYATYTGHIFDTTLDIYFAEARFYDAQTRTWLAMDPIKNGGNWYVYVNGNSAVIPASGLLKTVVEVALGIGNESVKSFVNNKNIAFSQIINAGIASFISSKVSNLIPSEAFNHPAAETKFGSAIIDYFTGGFYEKYAAEWIIDLTVPSHALETFIGSMSGNIINDILGTIMTPIWNLLETAKGFFGRVVSCG